MSSCLCPTSACTGQDIRVLALAARTGPHLPQQPGLGKAGRVPKCPRSCSSAHGVWGEILSLAPTAAPSRAPEVHIFIPS